MSAIVLCISTGLKCKSDDQVMDAKSTHTLTHHFQNTASNPKPCELPGLRSCVCVCVNRAVLKRLKTVCMTV